MLSYNHKKKGDKKMKVIETISFNDTDNEVMDNCLDLFYDISNETSREDLKDDCEHIVHLILSFRERYIS